MTVAVLLATDRDDVAGALAAGDGTDRWRIHALRVDDVEASKAGEYAVALLDLATNPARAMALARRLRGASAGIEIIALVADERMGFDAVRGGAFDFLVWPPADDHALWTLLAGCVKKVAPVSTYVPAALGRWRIVKRLGAGGMAEVFLAETPGRAEPVVVKCLLPEIAIEREFVEMFTAEARLSSTLDHPNIVRVLDFGRSDGQLYMVMEWVEGQNLEQVVRSSGRFPPALACWVVAEVAKALGYAHAKTDASGKPLAIIHRDVNPPNILVAANGRVKLTDFGIAKTAERRSQTTHGVMKGKLDYMSPEQVEGAPLDHRADVFSLGAVLYLLLSGTHPFRASTALQTLNRIRTARCEPPSTVTPHVPKSLDPIVMRALARAPADRYARAADLERDLRAWIAAEAERVDETVLAAFIRGTASSDPAREAMSRVPTRKVPRVMPGDEGTAPVSRPTNLAPPVMPETTQSGERTVPRHEPTVVSPPREDTVVRAPAMPEKTAPGVVPSGRSEESEPSAASEDTLAAVVPAEKTASSAWSGVEEERGTVTDGNAIPDLFPSPRRARPWLAIAGGAGALAAVAAIAWTVRTSGTPPAAPRAAATSFEPPSMASLSSPAATSATASSPAPSRTPLPTPSPARTAVALVTPPRSPTATPARPSHTPRIARKGTLSIWLVGGWASISIDGRNTGEVAPVVGMEIPEGKHRVTLENPGLGFRREYDVLIQPGRESKLTVTLAGE